jgi:hypothetical protein
MSDGAEVPPQPTLGNEQARRAKWVGKLDWGAQKPQIKQLYMTENKPLVEVMEVMKRDHDFNATYASALVPLHGKS